MNEILHTHFGPGMLSVVSLSPHITKLFFFFSVSSSSQNLRSLSSNKLTSSNQETYPNDQHKVDLLSAFGIFHNHSVHHGKVLLQPGPHSVTPSAFFGAWGSGLHARNVRMDLELFSHKYQESFMSEEGTSQMHRNHLFSKNKLYKLMHELLRHDDTEIQNHDLSLMASIRQWRGNTGTIFSIVRNIPGGRHERYISMTL